MPRIIAQSPTKCQVRANDISRNAFYRKHEHETLLQEKAEAKEIADAEVGEGADAWRVRIGKTGQQL